VDPLRVGQGLRDLVLATARVGFVRRVPAVSCGTWTPLMPWFEETTVGLYGSAWRGHAESLTAFMRVHSAATGGLDSGSATYPGPQGGLVGLCGFTRGVAVAHGGLWIHQEKPLQLSDAMRHYDGLTVLAIGYASLA
jgi:hypothetical protein